MNEQIKELRIQAAEWMKIQGLPLEYRSAWEKQCDEKFSELLINKCAELAEKYTNDSRIYDYITYQFGNE